MGNGSFYSSDNAAYHVTWLTCMRDAWGVAVDYVGVWNERGFDAAWIKVQRVSYTLKSKPGTLNLKP